MAATAVPVPPLDPRPSGPPLASPAATRHRSRGKTVGVGLLLIATLAATAVASVWSATPGVADAEARARAAAAAHDAPDPGGTTPNRVAASVTAVEDSRFYHDHGIDPPGVARAATSLIRAGDQGGSTIDQQLARLLYTHRSGPAAKVEQVILGVKLDRRYPKNQILEMYLAVAYLGHGYYGITAASAGYFGVPPAQLSWAQAALLAGLLAAPSAYDPLTRPDLARQRQLTVLRRLVATHHLTAAQAATIAAAGLQLHPRTDAQALPALDPTMDRS